MTLWLFLSLGGMFSLLASLMSFAITYSEYSRHYREKRKAIQASLGTAAVTFVFFLVLSLVAGVILSRMLSHM